MASKRRAGKPSLADKCKRADFRFAPALKKDYFWHGLSDGVMVTQRPLEALFMVRIHVGQPIPFKKGGKKGSRHTLRPKF
jgi:hypothetical protein